MDKQRTALVSGASSGIGRAITRRFANEGALVIALARRKALLLELEREFPESVYPLQADVSDYQSLQLALTSLPSRFECVDLLVNNAGITIGNCEGGRVSFDELNRLIDVNVKGILNSTHVPSHIKGSTFAIKIPRKGNRFAAPAGL